MGVRQMANRKVGKVVHFFDKISVAIIDLTAGLKKGDQIEIVGKSPDYSLTIGSMEIDHKKVSKAKKGDSIGIKVDQKLKDGDQVYKVS